jgi:hypothetical protein
LEIFLGRPTDAFDKLVLPVVVAWDDERRGYRQTPLLLAPVGARNTAPNGLSARRIQAYQTLQTLVSDPVEAAGPAIRSYAAEAATLKRDKGPVPRLLTAYVVNDWSPFLRIDRRKRVQLAVASTIMVEDMLLDFNGRTVVAGPCLASPLVVGARTLVDETLDRAWRTYRRLAAC